MSRRAPADDTRARLVEAIASLQARRARVSLPALSAETARLAPDRAPVAQSTICRNPAYHALYAAAATAPPRSRRRREPVPARLMRASKWDLAAALLRARRELRGAKFRLESLASENERLRQMLRSDAS